LQVRVVKIKKKSPRETAPDEINNISICLKIAGRNDRLYFPEKKTEQGH